MIECFYEMFNSNLRNCSNGTSIFPAMDKSDEGREIFVQAGYQLAALAIVLLVSIVAGAVTGKFRPLAELLLLFFLVVFQTVITGIIAPFFRICLETELLQPHS